MKPFRKYLCKAISKEGVTKIFVVVNVDDHDDIYHWLGRAIEEGKTPFMIEFRPDPRSLQIIEEYKTIVYQDYNLNFPNPLPEVGPEYKLAIRRRYMKYFLECAKLTDHHIAVNHKDDGVLFTYEGDWISRRRIEKHSNVIPHLSILQKKEKAIRDTNNLLKELRKKVIGIVRQMTFASIYFRIHYCENCGFYNRYESFCMGSYVSSCPHIIITTNSDNLETDDPACIPYVEEIISILIRYGIALSRSIFYHQTCPTPVLSGIYTDDLNEHYRSGFDYLFQLLEPDLIKEVGGL